LQTRCWWPSRMMNAMAVCSSIRLCIKGCQRRLVSEEDVDLGWGPAFCLMSSPFSTTLRVLFQRVVSFHLRGLSLAQSATMLDSTCSYSSPRDTISRRRQHLPLRRLLRAHPNLQLRGPLDWAPNCPCSDGENQDSDDENRAPITRASTTIL
jgi:hypothetical protein